MQDRETKTIDLGEGLKAVIKTYATARESQAIKNSYFIGTKIEVVGETPKINDFNPSVQNDVEKSMVKMICVSIGDKTENLDEVALDLKVDQYNVLISEIDALVSKKK